MHQLNLPSSKTCHPSVPRVYQIKTKISNFGYLHILSAHILIWNLQILRMSKWQVAACSVLSPSKSYIIELRRFWLSAYSDPYKDMRGQYVQITKIRYLCFDFVHSRYTRMAGFGRREIELMQALCIYNIYIEYYSVVRW